METVCARYITSGIFILILIVFAAWTPSWSLDRCSPVCLISWFHFDRRRRWKHRAYCGDYPLFMYSDILRQYSHMQAWRGHVWKYIASEVRSSPSSPSSSEADQNEQAANLWLLENYLTYVQSSREHRELLARYQGRGERSVEESAHLVGLELPNQSTAWNPATTTCIPPPPKFITIHTLYYIKSCIVVKTTMYVYELLFIEAEDHTVTTCTWV